MFKYSDPFSTNHNYKTKKTKLTKKRYKNGTKEDENPPSGPYSQNNFMMESAPHTSSHTPH